MNRKHLHFLNNMTSLEQIGYGKNDSFKSPEKLTIIAEKQESSESHSVMRIKELEDLNVHLENQIYQRANELKEVITTNNKYISIIAHDLRSPFASIIGALEILKINLHVFDIHEIENMVTMTSNSANRTLTLLDNLLAWTIAQNKENSIHPVKINLYKLVEDEIESIKPSAKQKNITLNLKILPKLNVNADIQMIKTVFRNLISNAVKYTNNGGLISISASDNKPFVEIIIKDTGIGISKEVQNKLFKMDLLNSANGTNGERGTGLGLMLCKEFVELHGGTIHINSEPGKGSEFTFTLPHYI